MRPGCLALLILAALPASAHPGNGIVALSATAVLTGDAVSNGVWRFEIGKAPARLVSSFHCHWVTKGLDGRLYAETLGESGGAWRTSIYRLDTSGLAPTPIASAVDAAHGVFLVDDVGRLVYQGKDGLVVDVPGGGTQPFRGSGRVARGVQPLGTIKALAWGPGGALYASDGDRILRAGADGELSEIAKIEGKILDRLYAGVQDRPLIWGLAVDAKGAAYAATPALGHVLRIAPDGKQTVVARSENGWAATGVAVWGSSVFLLESKTTERNNYGPRVRGVQASGPPQAIGAVNPEP